MAPEIRVVLLTVFNDTDKIFNAVCAGANGYLLKTSSTDQVLSLVPREKLGGLPFVARRTELRKVTDRPFFAKATKGILRSRRAKNGVEGSRTLNVTLIINELRINSSKPHAFHTTIFSFNHSQRGFVDVVQIPLGEPPGEATDIVHSFHDENSAGGRWDPTGCTQ